jgi:hypothetical protein
LAIETNMKSSDFEQPEIIYKPKTGFIVLLDALGIKTLSSDEVSSFMKQRKFVLQIIDEIMPWLVSRWQSEIDGPDLPSFLTFGDTFIILFPLKAPDKMIFLQSFQEFSSALGYLISLSFIAGLKLRGALSYGEFYYDKGVIIGPAIADAACWYEQTELIGLISTPNTSEILRPYLTVNSLNSEDKSIKQKVNEVLCNYARLYWPKYDVPSKKTPSINTLCLNWPYQLLLLGPEITEFTGEHVSSFLYRKLRTAKKPPEAKTKYDNTKIFYDYCISHIARIEAQYWTLALERGMASDKPLPWIKSFLKKYTIDDIIHKKLFKAESGKDSAAS